MMDLHEVEPETVLGQLDGATIKHHFIENESGLHFVMKDGRTLVICAVRDHLVICVVPHEAKELH